MNSIVLDTLNRDFSTLYQSIRSFENGCISLGDPEGIRTPDLQDENLMS